MKVVINKSWGGFHLSEQAYAYLKRQSDPVWENSIECRTNPELIEFVETHTVQEIGSELTVVEVPKGEKFRISEYDGYESIELLSETKWYLAT